MKTSVRFLVLAAVWVGCVAAFGCASAPGTPVAKLVTGQDRVTRAQFVALLAEACDPPVLAARSVGNPAGKLFVTPMEHLAAIGAVSVAPPNDAAAGHPSAIVLRLRGLDERGAEGRIHPDAPLTRAELALVIEDLLPLGSGEAARSNVFLGGVSPFPDLRPDHYAFNAALVATTRGPIETGRGGAFGPDRLVNGDEALAAIRKLDERIRETKSPRPPVM